MCLVQFFILKKLVTQETFVLRVLCVAKTLLLKPLETKQLTAVFFFSTLTGSSSLWGHSSTKQVVRFTGAIPT